MTNEQKLERLRILIGEDPTSGTGESDATLLVYLDMAAETVLNRLYPLKKSYEGLEVPDRYAQIQLKVAAYYLQKRGAEGEIQHIENGVHRNYGSADVPDGMLKDIVPFVAVM